MSFHYLLEDGSGSLLLESGNGYLSLESFVAASYEGLDVYDNLNGSVVLAWGELLNPPADSYNVYVNGVLNQNIDAYTTTVSGLTQTTYSPTTVAASTGNSIRPQNMPPVGFVTPSTTYDIHVTAVRGGVELARSQKRRVTPGPFSIMLRTPMRRPWPFPSTGSPDG
jgi:hypothetical protein